MTFNALMVEKDEVGTVSAGVQAIDQGQLPDGDVTIAVEYSTVNYKDGLCLGSGGGLVRSYPHVPGVDLAGVVEQSDSDSFKPGDRVVSTGWRVGETHWGGYAQKARLKSEWLVLLPDSLSTRDAMIIGTAGLTAILAIRRLESTGMKTDDRPVLVTGASGGVGSMAVALLSRLGYEVAAVTGRPDNGPYLEQLGADQIIDRAELAETVKRPLESERWGGCIDSVGGAMLARVLGQMAYNASIVAVGLAGGASLPASVIPFLLRQVSLIGIDSVMCPLSERRVAWVSLARLLPRTVLDDMATSATLAEVPKLGEQILAGQVRGRIVVDVNA